MPNKAGKSKLEDALNRIGDEADFDEYRDKAKRETRRMRIFYESLIEVGFSKEESFQILLGTPFFGCGEGIGGFEELNDEKEPLF